MATFRRNLQYLCHEIELEPFLKDRGIFLFHLPLFSQHFLGCFALNSILVNLPGDLEALREQVLWVAGGSGPGALSVR